MEKSKENNKTKTGFLSFGNIKDILIIAFIIVVTWKLINSNISISMESFSFTDLLSMFLAFFAIALSAAFYFKAIDTSNLFYDNTYKFTKEVSEILGRIEAGFGERLKHIDEGYTGLRDKFDQMPFDINEAKIEEKKEELNIKEQEKERNQIIIGLMEKARVADDDKEKVLKDLNKHTKELDNSKMELRRLQREINLVESNVSDVSDGFINHFSRAMDNQFSRKYTEAPTSILKKRFFELLSDNKFDDHDVQYMMGHGLIDEEKQLTSKGARVMREAIRRAI